MNEAYLKTIAFLLMIALGYTLKRMKLFNEQSATTLMTIIMKITLPATIIASFADFKFEFKYLSIALFCILANVVLSAIGYLIARKKTPIEKSYNMVNYTSFSTGSFSIPFLQSFIGDYGVIIASFFDAGNTVTSLGFNYSLAYNISKGKNRIYIKDIIRKLLGSVPFVVYIILFVLSGFNISLPGEVYEIASMFAAGNGFLAMFVVGMSLEFVIEKSDLKDVIINLLVRYSITASIAIIIYSLNIFPDFITKVIILLVMAPTGQMNIIITEESGGNRAKASLTNSLTIIISMIIITILLNQ